MENFLSIIQGKVFTSEILINKSRFLGFAKFVENAEHAEEFIQEIRKKYSDARHVCFAYRLLITSKASDDGEPSGTAGRPILQVLEKQNLYNVVLVVVRYFGGIKLGAGGLLRAYTGTATSCLENSQKIMYYRSNICKIKLDYNKYQPFLKQIENRFVVITNTNFENGAEIDFIAREDEEIDNAQILGKTMCCFPNMSNKG